MQQFYAKALEAWGLEEISAPSVQNVRRVIVWFALVSAAALVGLIWMTALVMHMYGSASVMDDYFATDAYPGTLSHAARDNVDITKAFSKRHDLAAHLRCFSETGRWVYDPTPKHLPWNYFGEVELSSCDFDHQLSKDGNVYGDLADEIAARGDSANWSVREQLKWVWQTDDSCPWQSFNREDFCRMMGSNRHVLIVGDSLNHHILFSFINALLVNKSTNSKPREQASKPEVFVGPEQMCDDTLSPGRGFNVSYVRNDRLSDVNDTEGGFGNFYEFPWIPLLRERDIKVLVLNRGAHYEEDAIYADALRHAYTVLSSEFPDILVIYRNSQVGHANCMNFTEPISSYPTEFIPTYHWEEFKRQNALAKNITDEFGYIYMNTSAMLSLRADGHRSEFDCLHYCVPGPLDVVTEYLYNLMLAMRDLVVI